VNREKKEPGIRLGFKPRDEHYLRDFDNAAANPQIQTFSDQDPEEDNEDKRYFCAMCKTRLEFYHDLDEWFCEGCGQHYDTKIQDRPLTDIKDFQLVPYTDQRHYPQFDENDPNLPFVHSIDVDKLAGEAEIVEIVKTSPDHRVKHIRVKGSPAEVLAATKEME
jgi:hypothetical protein